MGLLVKLNEDGSLDLSSYPKVQARIQAMQGVTEKFADSDALMEFQDRFYSQEACADYLFTHKWPNGFICSRCAHTSAVRITTRRLPLLQCRQCHYQASPIVDNLFNIVSALT